MQTPYIWTEVVKVVGDGTNAGRGVLPSGLGPVTFNTQVPVGAIASRIVPKWISSLTTALAQEITNQIFEGLNFGIRYDIASSSWKIITTSNIDLTSPFSLGKSGDSSNGHLDASWIVSFVKLPDQYQIRIRTMAYVFGSVQQNRFYFDNTQRLYNSQTGKVVKDQVKILNINAGKDLITSLKYDVVFEIDDAIKFDDGYQSTKEIKLAFFDSDNNNAIDNPDSFEDVVGEDALPRFLFFVETTDTSGTKSYDLIDNINDTILIRQTEATLNPADYDNGQLIYFYDSLEDRVKKVDSNSNTLILQTQYTANRGRDKLKFQYLHNAASDRRIDPSSSNIIDLYILTRAYDTDYRNWLAGAISVEPAGLDHDELRDSFGAGLSAIKSISDELAYHSVKYKVLFGAKADIKLQAQFKIVKNPNKAVNDNDIKVRIINAINDFFDVNNWDFGDRFYLSELTTYILNVTAPDISNLVIVPRQTTQVFGSLFEIQSAADEIFVSGATVDDVEIVTAITASEIRATTSSVVNTTA